MLSHRFHLPRVWIVELLFSFWFMLSFIWAGCHCMHWGYVSGCGGACMPSESVPLDILLMLLLTRFHFACMHCCRPHTQYWQTHTQAMYSQPSDLKAGGGAQSHKGLGIRGSQHGFEELRAAAVSAQVCQVGVELWLVGPAPASKMQKDRAEFHWQWFKDLFRTGGNRKILV